MVSSLRFYKIALTTSIVIILSLLVLFLTSPSNERIKTKHSIPNDSKSLGSLNETSRSLSNSKTNSNLRLDKLENSLIILIEEITKLKTSVAELNINSAQSEPPLEKKPRLTKQEKQLLNEERVAIMERRLYADEQQDTAWTPIIEETIQTKLNEVPELAKASDNTSFQCGGTLCKITARLPSNLSSTEKEEFLWSLQMSLGQELPQSTGGMGIINTDGSQELTLYLARRGYPLPPSGH